VSEDIGNYLEGGVDKCRCGHSYYPPTQYEAMD